MLLTGIQIGVLAEHLLYIIRKYGVNPEKNTNPETPQAWERDLSIRISADSRLPDYDFIQTYDAEILEFLIAYYVDGLSNREQETAVDAIENHLA